MGRIVIAAYRPKSGRQQALERLMRLHHERLRAEGLVTDRPPVLMRAGDGTMLEIVEWLSADAIAAAHRNRALQAMQDEYADVSDTVPLREIEETGELLAEFEPLLRDEALHPEFSP